MYMYSQWFGSTGVNYLIFGSSHLSLTYVISLQSFLFEIAKCNRVVRTTSSFKNTISQVPPNASLAKHYQLCLSDYVFFVQDPSNWLASSNIQCLALAPRSDKVGISRYSFPTHIFCGIIQVTCPCPRRKISETIQNFCVTQLFV